MAARVYLVEDGYAIRGAEPPSLRKQPESVRLLFWGWIVEFGLRAKDRDLAQGLDKDGKPLRAISAATRRHRHSEMMPGGKGDPSAPPLEPGRQRSRIRSLLTGRAFADHAEFWWKFDPFTGDSWAKILEMQKEQGRDVFGLSPRALRRVVAQAWERYRKWEAGKPVPMPVVPQIAMARPIEMAGKTIGPYSTLGIGPAPRGQFSGGMRIEDWIERMRQPARVIIPGRLRTDYNRILGHIWGQPAPPARKQKAAMGPKPPPKPKLAPWAWGTPIEPDRPIAERILKSPAWGRTKELAKESEAYTAAREASRAAESAYRSLQDQAMAAVRQDVMTDEAKAALLARIKATEAECRELRKLRDKAKQDLDAYVGNLLKPPKGVVAVEWRHDSGGLASREAKEAAETAQWWLGRFVVRSPDDYPVRVEWEQIDDGKTQRDHALPDKGKIRLSKATNAGVAAHEFGHVIEGKVAGVKVAAREFLAHRVKDEGLRPMAELIPGGKYDADEMGREDDFRKTFGALGPYAGKHYDDGWTEIISMGVEKLYNDPGGFARDDPEYCAFVLGILDGSLRKP